MEQMKQITEKELLTLNIQFAPTPVDYTDVQVDIKPGELIDELCNALHIVWFPVYAGDGRRDFTVEQFKKYFLYLIQERIKQVREERYDRAIRIPASIFQVVGSIYKYVDKKRGIILVPHQAFEEIQRDSDIDQVARLLQMMSIPTTCNMPVEIEGSSPSAIWASVVEDVVVAYDEITLLDALFTSIINREIVSTVYGDPRVEYCNVRALIPAVVYLAK